MRQLLLLIILLTTKTVNAQCVDSDKVVISGDFGGHQYITFCPTYNFSFEGDTSKEWNILNNPIDINQVSFLIDIKDRLELKIRNYSGDNFFSHLKFYSVEMSCPDSIKNFRNRGPKVVMDKCKAKYFFYYYFIPTDGTKHCIGIALNEKEEIISQLNFPSKQEFKPIDTILTVCKVIEIAKQTNPQIEPIDKISFDFDNHSKEYYWAISQKIIKPVEGENEFNKVLINAADYTKTKRTKGKTFIQYHNRL